MSTIATAAFSAVRLLVVEGDKQLQVCVDAFPFRIGRSEENDLVIPSSSVSRRHAELRSDGTEVCLFDLASRFGTHVNGDRVQSCRLRPDDQITFGQVGSLRVIFNPAPPRKPLLRDVWRAEGGELAQARVLIEAARRLNEADADQDVYSTVLDLSMRVTDTQRGFLYAIEDDGRRLCLLAAQTREGERIFAEHTVSHSVLSDVLRTGKEVIVVDTTEHSAIANRASIQTQNLKAVLCIPLRWHSGCTQANESMQGLLYLDGRCRASYSRISDDVVHSLARDAAALLGQARFARHRELARLYERELEIAADIQSHLLAVDLPTKSEFRVEAATIPCRSVGGDFYDVVVTDNDLYAIFGDVCGKGISAALLASVLQGAAHAQFLSGENPADVCRALNQTLCTKHLPERFATVVVLRLCIDGRLQIVNCGHIPPLICSASTATPVGPSAIPIGIAPEIDVQPFSGTLAREDRLLCVSDGVTDARNADGEMFELDRVKVLATGGVMSLLAAVRQFCAGVQLDDDCSAFSVQFLGRR